MGYVFNPFTANFDFTKASGTATSANLKNRVAVSPAVNGVVTSFTTPDSYFSGSLAVYLNGVYETYVTETSSTTFSMSTAPQLGDLLYVGYEVAAAVPGDHALLETGDGILMEDGSFLTLE